MKNIVSKKLTENPSEGGYIKFIAYLQVIGIILVVLGHSFHEYPDGSFGYSIPFLSMLKSFRMPLFIFVSGFLMVYTSFIKRSPEFKTFFHSKVKRLLLPYFVLSLVTFIPRSLMSGIADSSLSFSLDGLYSGLFIRDKLVIAFFWFLQASFVLLIISHGWLSLSKKMGVGESRAYWILFAVFVVLQLFPYSVPKIWALDKICQYAMFFACGMLYARYYHKINRFVPWTGWWFFVINVIIWAILAPLLSTTAFASVPSFFGILMCVSLAKIIEKNRWGFLDHLTGANYIIFLLSWYFNVVTQQMLAHYTHWPWWIYSLLSLFCGIYVPWLFYRWMLRHPESKFVRACAFLLGQSLKRSR